MGVPCLPPEVWAAVPVGALHAGGAVLFPGRIAPAARHRQGEPLDWSPAKQGFSLASVLEVTPRISATGIRNAIHFGRLEDLEGYLEGLRKAGLPE